MEPIYAADYPVTTLHADCFGRCKPSSLLLFAQEAAGAHCQQLGAGREAMAQRSYFWAVIRQRLEITRLPEVGETITVKTWPMPTTRTAYPRAVQGLDRAGNTLFRIISLWVIMDSTTRAMVLPGKSGIQIAGVSLGTELDFPAGLPSAVLDRESYRPVSFSDLDGNGHMNNTRYLDWLCDLLPAAYHKAHPMKAVTICYMSEAREGQRLRLGWSGEDTLRVDGSLPGADVHSGHTRIFSAQAEF